MREGIPSPSGLVATERGMSASRTIGGVDQYAQADRSQMTADLSSSFPHMGEA